MLHFSEQYVDINLPVFLYPEKPSTSFSYESIQYPTEPSPLSSANIYYCSLCPANVFSECQGLWLSVQELCLEPGAWCPPQVLPPSSRQASGRQRPAQRGLVAGLWIPLESLDEKLTFRQSRRGSPGQTWPQGAAEKSLTPQETKLYLTRGITSLKGSEGQGQIREKTEEIKQLVTREQD